MKTPHDLAHRVRKRLSAHKLQTDQRYYQVLLTLLRQQADRFDRDHFENVSVSAWVGLALYGNQPDETIRRGLEAGLPNCETAMEMIERWKAKRKS